MSGQVEPDTYVLAKDGPRITEVRVGHQTHELVFQPDGSNERRELEAARADRRVLSDDEVVELGRMAIEVETHYGEPQDIEWAIDHGTSYLLQARPITTPPSAAA